MFSTLRFSQSVLLSLYVPGWIMMVVPEVMELTAAWRALSVETIMISPPGEGSGGALQARCKGGAAVARSSKIDNRKVVTIDIVENLNISGHREQFLCLRRYLGRAS